MLQANEGHKREDHVRVQHKSSFVPYTLRSSALIIVLHPILLYLLRQVRASCVARCMIPLRVLRVLLVPVYVLEDNQQVLFFQTSLALEA
jgi:hypothetical protein